MLVKIDGIPIKHKTHRFSGGEIQVRLLDFPTTINKAEIIANITSSDRLMEVILATDALREISFHADIKLTIPYLPYARQDRVCYPGEAFALGVMADIINYQDYTEVEVWDVHSAIAGQQIDRLTNTHATEFVKDILLTNNTTIVVAPDAGAVDRASACAIALNLPIIQAEKVRDPNTGAITDTIVRCGDVGSADFLIVDDICDGGRTFIELAKKLRPLTTGRILLYVTHGIFSNDFHCFRDVIDHIYVANLWPMPIAYRPEFLTVLKETEDYENLPHQRY